MTPAELRVMRLVALGLTNKEIAAKLELSPRTVRTHLNNVYAKLGVNSRVQALNALGWVQIPGVDDQTRATLKAMREWFLEGATYFDELLRDE